MAKVKGYFNINNGVFLGPMTATNEATGVASTPRYIEGVCFGTFDTDTEEFVPETNPMHIPKGMIFTQDEQINEQGKLVNIKTGMEEDVGADFVSKIVGRGFATHATPNVVTKDESGKIYLDYHAKKKAQLAREALKPKKVDEPLEVTEPPEKIIEENAQVVKIKKEDLPKIDFDNLF